MNTNAFIQDLRRNENPEKIEQMEKYMRNQFQFLGLQAVERRALAQEFLKEKRLETKLRAETTTTEGSVLDWEMLFLFWNLSEREFQLIGLDYLKQNEKYLVLADFSNLRKLVLTKSWWDTIDVLAKNIGSLIQKEPELIEEMRNWSLEENIWIRRVSILHQLAFKEKTNTALLEEVIVNNLTDDEFFIRKAIGWALREYAKTDEMWVWHFVTKYEKDLSKLSYREAVKNLKSIK